MQGSFLILVVVACCLVGVSRGTDVSERILNGVEVTDNQDSQFVVALRCRGVHFCGGAIIAPQFVLTSAECVKQCALSELTVHSGSRFLNRAAMAHKPYHMIFHPYFNVKTKDFDVGLIKVLLSEQFNEFAPITITEDDLAAARIATALGWGVTAEGGEAHASVLRKVDVPVIPWTECFNKYNGRPGINITFNMMCTDNAGGSGTCEGDFGGPIVENSTGKNLLVGVSISSSAFCGRIGYPSVFLKLQNDVRKWIKTNAQV